MTQIDQHINNDILSSLHLEHKRLIREISHYTLFIKELEAWDIRVLDLIKERESLVEVIPDA